MLFLMQKEWEPKNVPSTEFPNIRRATEDVPFKSPWSTELKNVWMWIVKIGAFFMEFMTIFIDKSVGGKIGTNFLSKHEKGGTKITYYLKYFIIFFIYIRRKKYCDWRRIYIRNFNIFIIINLLLLYILFKVGPPLKKTQKWQNEILNVPKTYGYWLSNAF